MTAKVTIYRDSDVDVEVIDGAPPVDQSALVTQLQTQLGDAQTALGNMTSARDDLQGKLDRIKAARTAEDAGEHGADDARASIDLELA